MYTVGRGPPLNGNAFEELVLVLYDLDTCMGKLRSAPGWIWQRFKMRPSGVDEFGPS